MADIVTLENFASFLQSDLDTATANLLLIDLAQGLIVDEIGAQDPWPAVAKSVALAAAGRSYRNPEGVARETVGAVTSAYSAEEMGVYLTEAERARLHRWARDNDGSVLGAPTGSFPEALDWPDPADGLTVTDS